MYRQQCFPFPVCFWALGKFFLSGKMALTVDRFALGPFLQTLIYCVVMIFFGMYSHLCVTYDLTLLLMQLSHMMWEIKFRLVAVSTSLSSVVRNNLTTPEKDIYTVQSIGLWITDMLDGSGKRHYFHNGNLSREHLVNHTRTSRVELSIDLGLSLNTPRDILNPIKVRFYSAFPVSSFLGYINRMGERRPGSLRPKSLSSNFQCGCRKKYHEISLLHATTLTKQDMVTVSISCGLHCSWFDPRRGKARQEFINLIHRLISELGLVCIIRV